jgi:hypothetical protein
MKATGADLLPIHLDPLRNPDASQAAPGMLHDLYVPPKHLLDPRHKAAFVVPAIGPDEFESWEEPPQRLKQEFAPVVVLDVGFMDEHVHEQAVGIDEQVPFAPFHAFAAVVAAPPPFWLVLTD